MYQILLLFFEMGNILYGSFAIEALSKVNSLFFDLLYLIRLCEFKLVYSNNQPSKSLLVEYCEHLICFVIF